MNEPSLRCADIPDEWWTRLQLHISQQWPRLTRHLSDAIVAAHDVKMGPTPSRVLIYVSSGEPVEAIVRRLQHSLPPGDAERIELRVLPANPDEITEHGLLYLPGRYVVPGGRFNELYGWDSYFIGLGVIQDGRVGLAQSIADQLLYEVQHYGFVLNSNRTYCLQRSNPPLLTRLVLEVFAKTSDHRWLERALPLLERYHGYWHTPPHFVAGEGLARYRALGSGPAPESVNGEIDRSGRHHYSRVCRALRENAHPEPWFDKVFDPHTCALTEEGYVNDRTVRESGFDLTNRFGFCGLDSTNYIPVCLNTLLWRVERDLAEIHRLLGESAEAIGHWEALARTRAARMNDLFWDEEEGLFFDWNLRRGARSQYHFATAFWPLWAGWATPAQAKRVAARLGDFLAPGGLLTSLEVSGCQWDAPFTSAPHVSFAALGLESYGFHEEAHEVRCRFVALAAREFQRKGVLFEKYDSRAQTSDVEGKIRFGYHTNEVGFGWTNGVLAELLAG